MKRYENDWATKDFLIVYLKNSSRNARVKGIGCR
jgi:hypothetical protein